MKKPLIAGVIGFPTTHSLSPEIFEWIGKKLKTSTAYSKINITPKDLERDLASYKKLPFLSGWNVTLPHKQTVMQWLDEVSPEAARVGAVNVVKADQDKWIGYNTDVMGVRETFREHRVKLSGKSVLLLGAGGASRSVVSVLGQQGVKKVYWVNRDVLRVKKAIAEVQPFFPKTEFEALTTKQLRVFEQPVDLYVNSTPLGMSGFEQTLLYPKAVKKGAYAFDLVYRPQMTPFLTQAKKDGLKIIGGLDMLVWQAIGAWELWMNRVPQRIKLKEELKKNLQKKLKDSL